MSLDILPKEILLIILNNFEITSESLSSNEDLVKCSARRILNLYLVCKGFNWLCELYISDRTEPESLYEETEYVTFDIFGNYNIRLKCNKIALYTVDEFSGIEYNDKNFMLSLPYDFNRDGCDIGGISNLYTINNVEADIDGAKIENILMRILTQMKQIDSQFYNWVQSVREKTNNNLLVRFKNSLSNYDFEFLDNIRLNL